MTDNKFKHYHMCSNCAVSMGGEMNDGQGITVMRGTCEYCKKENQMLIPWVDFDWPKDKKKLAKISRD